MSSEATTFGLSASAKLRLMQRISGRPSRPDNCAPVPATPERLPLGDAQVREDLRTMRRAGAALGLDSPYFRVHDGIAGDTTAIGGSRLINFASYNYLGLNGDPRVTAAAADAAERHGTSVSASRLVSGERPVHRALERALASLHGAEDCVAMVSGHATNVTVLGHLVGPGDAIVHDERAHNSVLQGARLSGAHRVPFAHNDPAALARALTSVAGHARRVLVAIEGHYSMDGDRPDLAAMVREVRRHRAWLMVDEAHSVGVLGARGLGVAEECGVDPTDVDIWMGTLSKTLASCGGYIAASREIVAYLRESAPGFVYSVGLPAPAAAASLAALRIMHDEPWRVARLRDNAGSFLGACRAHGLDTGTSAGAAIVPVILGSSIQTARAADALFRRGVNVLPILYPAVPERSARLRFFVSSLHTETQLREAADAAAAAVAETRVMPVDLADLAKRLRG